MHRHHDVFVLHILKMHEIQQVFLKERSALKFNHLEHPTVSKISLPHVTRDSIVKISAEDTNEAVSSMNPSNTHTVHVKFALGKCRDAKRP